MRGRHLDRAISCVRELLMRALVMGLRYPAADVIGGRMSARDFGFRIADRGDLARFMVVRDESMTDAVFSPTRTCAGGCWRLP